MYTARRRSFEQQHYQQQQELHREEATEWSIQRQALVARYPHLC
jgi:hypothetical protein